MIRTLMWGGLWLVTLGLMDIKITYRDGLHIHFKRTAFIMIGVLALLLGFLVTQVSL